MAPRGSDLVDDRRVDDEVSHPVRLWHSEYVWMLTQTPGKNARSRTGGTDNKNWPVYLILHFSLTRNLCDACAASCVCT